MKWLIGVGGLLISSLIAFLFIQEIRIIQKTSVNSWTEPQSADCAVVLTGGPGRVREGFDLLSQKRIKKLIISGVFSESSLREIMPLWPLYGDLSEVDVILEKRSESTFGNAQQSLPIVEALNCRDILLVTSKVHMHRSFLTFRKSYPENIQILPHAVVGGDFRPRLTELVVETLKSLFYSLWAYPLDKN